MTQKIGPRELALRAMREADASMRKARAPFLPLKPTPAATKKALAEKIAQVPARKPAKAKKAKRPAESARKSP